MHHKSNRGLTQGQSKGSDMQGIKTEEDVLTVL